MRKNCFVDGDTLLIQAKAKICRVIKETGGIELLLGDDKDNKFLVSFTKDTWKEVLDGELDYVTIVDPEVTLPKNEAIVACGTENENVFGDLEGIAGGKTEINDAMEHMRMLALKDVDDQLKIDLLKKYNEADNNEDSEFGDLCLDIRDLHARKNADYGNAFGELYGRYGINYALAHMTEKLMRIESVLKKGNKVNGESVKDSLKDLASYALMTLAEINKEDGKDS